ncbi:hypothetical protein D9M68_853030 [compost metagenome]
MCESSRVWSRKYTSPDRVALTLPMPTPAANSLPRPGCSRTLFWICSEASVKTSGMAAPWSSLMVRDFRLLELSATS